MGVVNYETIKNRLGYDIRKAVEEHFESLEGEYDGPFPTDVLTDEEKEFMFTDLMKKHTKNKKHIA